MGWAETRKENMKVFISMAMKNKSTAQVEKEMNKIFQQIKKKLPEAKWLKSVIDGADEDIAIKGDGAGLWYLGKSLQILAEADIVFFADGWQDARRCKLEYQAAKAYGKYCVELS